MSFTPVLDADERMTFPPLETFSGNRFYLLMVLNDVALVHIQQNRQGKALAVYDVVTQLINLIRRDFIGEDEKMNVSGKTRDIMEKALNVCIELYDKYHDKKYLEQAFNFSEQSKAMTLLENARLKITADLPDSVKQKLSDIKNNLSEVVNKLAEDPTNTEYLNIKKQLDTEKRSIWQEVTQSLKYDGGNLLTFEQVQKHLLADNQALVEYFIEKNAGKLHTFVIQKNDSMRHIVVRIDTTFEQNIDSMYKYVTQRGNINQAAFCQRSHILYKKLIEPIANELPPRVLIVPEYPLSKVPFEALLTKPNVRTYDSARSEKAFLLFNHSIFYNYSANLHYLMLQDSTGQSDKFLKLVAFAPSFQAPIKERIFSMQNPVELNPINNKVNEKEITSIAQYVNTKLYADKAATKERLLESFQNYTAIHISTHGVLLNDAKLSFISLSQNASDLNTQQILSLHELFGQSLSHVKLVFLSACETGISEKEDYKGEGMLSMAWGLASAGVKSFVTTLWSVDAEATSELTPHFYNYLKNEPSGFKDIALTKAKIQYLDTHEKGKSNPFFGRASFWSGILRGGIWKVRPMPFFQKCPLLLVR
jgi:CHAT domain-containing protein